ncbi:MAG: hypothetical protein IJW03_01330 [Clostridia bacterium]|nr:hypothetical protein [Clostridia bacterium]
MKISYETHYKSLRDDGRHTSPMAALMERLRRTPAALEFQRNCSLEQFFAWREELKLKVRELLRLDVLLSEANRQPAPQMISSVQRDGYRVERWEMYPDDYSVVPFLALIPDGASEKNRVPAVMCFPGSTFSKEFISGEPLLDMANCHMDKYPERNRMALYIVKNGMAAFAFDNPETAECTLEIEREGDFGGKARNQLCHGLLHSGFSYFGVSTAQKLVALAYIKTLPYVDNDRLAVSAHSLGCDDAMHVSLLCDEIRAVVFNDLVGDARQRYYATTEYDETRMCNDVGAWHIVPGAYMNYDRTDMLAALAPRWLALNEGGAEYYLDKIRRAYKLQNAEGRLQVTHYPKYSDPDTRCRVYLPPESGLSAEGYFEYTNTDAPDHSYREEPSISLLKKAFF